MLLRIKQVRQLPSGKGFGTDIVLGRGPEQRTYQFRPQDPKKPESDHACNVADAKDVAHLLSIPEGFEIHASEHGKRKVAAAEGAGTGTTPETPPPVPPAKAGAEMTRKQMLAAVKKKTGKNPNPATSTKKLMDLLAA